MITNKSESLSYIPEDHKTSTIAKSIWGSLVAILIAIAPKCPLCWAAYLSFFGLSGIVPLTFYKWLTPLLIGLFVIHLFAIGKRAYQRKHFLPLLFSGAGFITILLGFHLSIPALRYTGAALVFIGSANSAFSKKKSTSACSCTNKNKNKN